MNKKAISALVVLVLFAATLGGYIWAKRAVRANIDKAIAAATQSDIVNAISYGGIHINLLNDTLTFTDFRVKIDAAHFLKSIDRTNSGAKAKITGSLQEHADVITLRGIRALVFKRDAAINVNIVNDTFDVSTVQNWQNAAHAKMKIRTRISGTIKQTRIQGVNWSNLFSFQNGGRLTPVQQFQADGTSVDITTNMVSPADAIAEPSVLRPLRSMKMHYTIASMSARNITANHWGEFGIKNTVIKITPPPNGPKPFTFTIGRVDVTNTTLVDAIPVKSNFEIKDLVFENPRQTNPRLNATLTMLGIDKINFNARVAYNLDEGTHTFSLAPLALGLKNLGRIRSVIVFTDVPALEAIKSLQNRATNLPKAKLDAETGDAFNAVALKRVSVEYEDEGVLKKFLAALSMRTGGNPGVLAKAYAGRAAATVNAIYGAAKAADAETKFIAFLKNPTKIKIALSAATPVKLNALPHMFKTWGPRALSVFQLDITGP